MNHKILESIVITQNADGSAHIAPMGVWQQEDYFVLAPFKPSRTLDNINRSGYAVVNFTDQVKVFAGCLTGRRQWPLSPTKHIPLMRLSDAQTSIELERDHVHEDDVRPQIFCREVWRESHRAFNGFNRAQSAVIELAVLVSRLQRLPAEKIAAEVTYLAIAIEKTAGPDEREAWGWLMEKIDAFTAKEK